MGEKIQVLLLVLVLSLGAISCRRIEGTKPIPGGLPFETAKFEDAIPTEYGELVAVTAHPEKAHWAALWFKKADQTIAVVWVNVVEGQIQKEIVTIPRR